MLQNNLSLKCSVNKKTVGQHINNDIVTRYIFDVTPAFGGNDFGNSGFLFQETISGILAF